VTAVDAGELFDGRAYRYDGAYDAVTAEGYALRSRMAAVLSLLDTGPGTLLDAGMGPGRLLEQLDRLGWTVHGVDLSPEMVEIARAHLPAARERLALGSIEALPFPDETFDAVVATGVLEYATLPTALRELARVLRPGGRCVVSYPNPRALYAIWKSNCYYPVVRVAKRVLGRSRSTLPAVAPPHVAGDFRGLLVEAGLAPKGVTYTSFLVLPAPFDELLPRAGAAISERVDRRGLAPSRFATQVVFGAMK
jgi:ubiquinone/menaquinone biosynthesis C-methylase UbiE